MKQQNKESPKVEQLKKEIRQAEFIGKFKERQRESGNLR